MFTLENTVGFSQTECDLLNKAVDHLLMMHDYLDPRSAGDRVNNNYFEGAKLEDLIK